MTTTERKRGLRAAVEAKVHHPDPNFRMLFPDQIDLLWEVIDSLVDECARAPRELSADAKCPKCDSDFSILDHGEKMHPRYSCENCDWMFDLNEVHPGSPPADTGEQYRCLWEERFVWPDDPSGYTWFPNSGKVYDSIGPCIIERAGRMAARGYRRVLIQARPKSEGSWPRPWEEEEKEVERD